MAARKPALATEVLDMMIATMPLAEVLAIVVRAEELQAASNRTDGTEVVDAGAPTERPGHAVDTIRAA